MEKICILVINVQFNLWFTHKTIILTKPRYIILWCDIDGIINNNDSIFAEQKNS